MKLCDDGEERWEWVGLVWVCVGWAFVEEGYAEVEVGEGGGGKGFYQDVDDNIGVVEVWVELVAGVVNLVSESEIDGSVKYLQLEDCEVSKAVVFLATDLMVEVILKDSYV